MLTQKAVLVVIPATSPFLLSAFEGGDVTPGGRGEGGGEGGGREGEGEGEAGRDGGREGGRGWRSRYSCYLLYWYKSTNTDTLRAGRRPVWLRECGYSELKLPLEEREAGSIISKLLAARYSVYLLYWYKSTNTDAWLRECGYSELKVPLEERVAGGAGFLVL
jgi:hypothetical protein